MLKKIAYGILVIAAIAAILALDSFMHQHDEDDTETYIVHPE